jgi:hypothetical protein
MVVGRLGRFFQQLEPLARSLQVLYVELNKEDCSGELAYGDFQRVRRLKQLRTLCVTVVWERNLLVVTKACRLASSHRSSPYPPPAFL